MLKISEKKTWFLIIAVIALAGILAGMILLFSVNPESSIKIVLENQEFEVKSANQAEKLISDYYRTEIPKRRVSLKIADDEYFIDYSDIDISIDMDSIMSIISTEASQKSLPSLLFGVKRTIEVAPVFSYNSGKLMKELKDVFMTYEKDGVADRYEISEGNLKYIPPTAGIKVSYKTLEERLARQLSGVEKEPLVIELTDDSVFTTAVGESRFNDSFDQLVSRAEIALAPGTEDIAQNSLKLLNEKVFSAGEEISIKSMLDFSQFSTDIEKDTLNRIATALYQSLMKIEGIKKINRLPSRKPVSYTQPGLEAVIEGEGSDLVMRNDTGETIMILAQGSSDSIGIYIASTKALRSGTLLVEEKDMISPPVITSVNSSLLPNESRVISEGKQGFTAHVSLKIGDDTEFLYSDKYEPVARIVETGQKPMDIDSK